MQVVRTPLGMLQQQSACPQCQGTGEIIDEYCGTCSGRGRVQKNKQLKITIPAGVDNGSRLRIRKEGDAGPKAGPPGDLYVFLSVKADKNFKREGADIYSQVPMRAPRDDHPDGSALITSMKCHMLACLPCSAREYCT
jgi:molecular chaperone DnaJ